MSAYPIVLEGSMITALVVGGGSVGTRKAIALLDAGAHVRVVAPVISPDLVALAAERPALQLTHARYGAAHVLGATLVVAATDDPELNTAIARDCHQRWLLVNVADAPDAGSFVTPAVHRVGDVVVAVSAGGVPTAAARIRDAIGSSFDDRYAAAVGELASLRRALIDGGRRERWAEAARALTGADFCDQVETGQFAARMAGWR